MVSINVYKEYKHNKGWTYRHYKDKTAKGRLVILEIHVGRCFRAAVTRTLPFLIQKCILEGARTLPTYPKIVH